MNPKDAIGMTKPPLHLIPPAAEVLESLVLGYGATKYGAWNWRAEKIQVMQYIGAIKRHIAAFVDGENNAADSGLPHLAHIRASLGILIDAVTSGRAIDDRPKPGAGAQLLNEHSANREVVRGAGVERPRGVTCCYCGEPITSNQIWSKSLQGNCHTGCKLVQFVVETDGTCGDQDNDEDAVDTDVAIPIVRGHQ